LADGTVEIMIEQARKLPPGAVITADICIVGGGAAGIAIAHELATSAQRVVLLAGGERRERGADRDLYRGEVAPGTSHEPLEEGRRRAWGGTTSAWSGRCVPLDPIDLERRAWVPHSGWPISYGELQPFVERANRVCEAGQSRYTTREAFPQSQTEMIAGFDGPDMSTSRLERFSPPTNFARRYGPALEKAKDIRVLLGAHAVALDLADNRRRIARVRAKSSTGRDLSVIANTYVLACGGLENARLLLASRHQCPNGIGNEHDNVGRYYMAHLYGILGWIELRAPDDGFVYGYERDEDGVYCRRRFWLTPEAQTEHKTGNCVGQLNRTDVSDPNHSSALLSAKHLAGAYRAALHDRRAGRRSSTGPEERAQRRSHWRVVARGAPSLIPEVTAHVHRRYFAPRQLPGILGPQSVNRFPLLYQAEHLPHRASRVELATTRDAFGMPRLRTRIAFTDDDVSTVETFHRVLAAQLCATGTGRFHPYDECDLRAQIEVQLAAFHSWYHHIGTTRMSVSRSDGVVDRDCRVHGVENLYVAGSSVFPTGGHANPTLTLVALALRLADHLRARR
jgi:choline dehydrogenase-like flavoprotein